MDQLCFPNAKVLTATKKKRIPNGGFRKKDLHILYFNINSLFAKIDKIRFIEKQSYASMIEISECTLCTSILCSEVDIEYYHQVIKGHSKRVAGFTCYIRKSLFHNHKSSFCCRTERIFTDIFCLNQKHVC